MQMRILPDATDNHPEIINDILTTRLRKKTANDEASLAATQHTLSKVKGA
jgi:hypothetical protein